MSERFDVIVVGAGAAGMMAAIAAAQRGAKTLVLERNEKVGRKIAITGKGRCNVTNACTRDGFFDAVKHNPRFLYSGYAAFDRNDTMTFFEKMGVPLKVERGNRVFPVSDRAFDIVDALRNGMRRAGAQLSCGVRVTELWIDDGVLCGVRDETGREYESTSVVVTCGGVSYPTTGSDGDGYALAKQAGHRLLAPRASLCAMTTSDGWTGKWAGLTLKNVTLHAKRGKKTIYEDIGEVLFTHSGVSGPLIFTLTSMIDNIEPEGISCTLDLKSGLIEQQLDARILREVSENPKKQTDSLFSGLLPHAMAQEMCRLCAIDPQQNLSQLSRAQRERMVAALKAFPIHLRGFAPIEEAVVTRGGVDVRRIDPSTMASKLLDGLYFAGEVIDVDAKTGGFNLQIAFSTGHLAGESAARAALGE